MKARAFRRGSVIRAYSPERTTRLTGGSDFLSWQVDARLGLSEMRTGRRAWVRDAADSVNTKSAFLRGCFVYPEACVGERSCTVKKCKNPTSEKRWNFNHPKLYIFARGKIILLSRRETGSKRCKTDQNTRKGGLFGAVGGNCLIFPYALQR